MKRCLLSVLLFVCLLPFNANAAKYGLNDWVNPTPDALAPFNGNVQNLAAMAADTVLVYPHPLKDFTLEVNGKLKEYHQQQFATAAVVLPVPADAVKNLIENYPAYSTFFPKTTQSTLLERNGRHTLMKYHVKIELPFPLWDVSEDVIAQHTIERDNLVSARLIEAPMSVGLARYEWFALDSQHTLVTFTTWADLNSARFLLRTVMNAFPDIKLAVPYIGNGFLAEAFRTRLTPDPRPGNTLPLAPPVQNLTLDNTQKNQLSQLLKNGAVSFIHAPVWILKNGKPLDLRFVTTLGQIHAPVEQTRALTSNYERYPEVFTQVRKVAVETNGGNFNVELKLGVGLGVFSLPIRVTLDNSWDKDQVLSFKASAGDVEHIYGHWRWDESPDNTGSWMTLHTAGKVGEHPPHLLKLAKYLPYNDFLPTMGAQVISLHKLGLWVEKQTGLTATPKLAAQKDRD